MRVSLRGINMTDIGKQREDATSVGDLVEIEKALWEAAAAIALRQAFLDDLDARLREMIVMEGDSTPTTARTQGESCRDDSR